ncbi:hypothetical protein MASR2M16_32880 [Thauera terpenica]
MRALLRQGMQLALAKFGIGEDQRLHVGKRDILDHADEVGRLLEVTRAIGLLEQFGVFRLTQLDVIQRRRGLALRHQGLELFRLHPALQSRLPEHLGVERGVGAGGDIELERGALNERPGQGGELGQLLVTQFGAAGRELEL